MCKPRPPAAHLLALTEHRATAEQRPTRPHRWPERHLCSDRGFSRTGSHPCGSHPGAAPSPDTGLAVPMVGSGRALCVPEGTSGRVSRLDSGLMLRDRFWETEGKSRVDS